MGVGLDDGEVELAFGERHDVVDRARRGVGAAADLAGEAARALLADGAGGGVVAAADGAGADGEEGEVGAAEAGEAAASASARAQRVRRMGRTPFGIGSPEGAG